MKLIDVNEQNCLEAARLCVSESQQKFLDRPVGILARGYVYRSCNAKVMGIADDNDHLIGIALVKDLEEEPACYDLQQFMIDKRFQNKGFGFKALQLILSKLCKEGKYSCVEVCVDQSNTAALKLFEKIGFEDTGYVDESVPDCKNLMYHFGKEPVHYHDELISDFSDATFQKAFKEYFVEMDVKVSDWDGLFKEMNETEGTAAFVRTTEKKK